MSGEIDRRRQQVSEALKALRLQKRDAKPGRGRGFNAQVAETLNARENILTHEHCAGCSAAEIVINDGKVAIGCSTKIYSPLNMWTDPSLRLGQEPECIGYQPVIDIPVLVPAIDEPQISNPE